MTPPHPRRVRGRDCKHKLAVAESCSAEIGVDTSPEYAPCGRAFADGTSDVMMDVIGFFCGKP